MVENKTEGSSDGDDAQAEGASNGGGQQPPDRDAFEKWRDAMPMITLDGEDLYVTGGDVLMSGSELGDIWNHRVRGSVPPDGRRPGPE